MQCWWQFVKWEFFKITKTVSSYLMLETVINSYYRGTTQLNVHDVLFRMYIHTLLIDNGSGSRQRLLWNLISSFRAALESPFSNSVHTAIPPPAALCDISEVLTPLSHRFVFVGTYHNAAERICQLFFQTIINQSSVYLTG